MLYIEDISVPFVKDQKRKIFRGCQKYCKFKLFHQLLLASKAELTGPRNDIKPADVIKIQLTDCKKMT